MAIKVKARGGETVEQMVRRFKKLCEKEGLTKEVKRRQYYEKPSETKRRNTRRGPRPLLVGAGRAGAAGGRGGPRQTGASAGNSRTGGAGGSRTGGSGGRTGGRPSGGGRGPSRG